MNELKIKASMWIHLKSTVLSKNNQKSCRVIHTGGDIYIYKVLKHAEPSNTSFVDMCIHNKSLRTH